MLDLNKYILAYRSIETYKDSLRHSSYSAGAEQIHAIIFKMISLILVISVSLVLSIDGQKVMNNYFFTFQILCTMAKTVELVKDILVEF